MISINILLRQLGHWQGDVLCSFTRGVPPAPQDGQEAVPAAAPTAPPPGTG